MIDKKNMILIGMMGSGKSTIGRIIARKIGFNFVDTDKEIEEMEHCTIKRIFDTKGEKYFRQLEEMVTLKTLKKKNYIISLGGGGFLNKNIRKESIRNADTFWLNWKNETLINRLSKSEKRPKILNLSRKELNQMIKVRSFIYKNAKYKIDCEGLNKEQIIKKILNYYENKKN